MGRVSDTVKRFLPRSLLGRSLMIIVTPLVLLQIVSGLIFFESHWTRSVGDWPRAWPETSPRSSN